MEIIHLRRNEHICSLCGKTIPINCECIKFFSAGRKKGVVHYRHLQCQYGTRERKTSLEKFIEDIRIQYRNKRLKKKLTDFLPKKFESEVFRCLWCNKSFLSKLGMEQHVSDKHKENCKEILEAYERG